MQGSRSVGVGGRPENDQKLFGSDGTTVLANAVKGSEAEVAHEGPTISDSASRSCGEMADGQGQQVLVQNNDDHACQDEGDQKCILACEKEDDQKRILLNSSHFNPSETYLIHIGSCMQCFEKHPIKHCPWFLPHEGALKGGYVCKPCWQSASAGG